MKKLLLDLLLVMVLSASAWTQGPSYPYSVVLTWTPSTTNGVTGQNMYRAPYTTACGTYAILPAGQNLGPTVTTFTDTTVANSGTYCYGVTAIGINGKESALDVNSTNPVQINPAPPTNLAATVN